MHRVYLDILHAHKVVSAKNRYLLYFMQKIQIFRAKIIYFSFIFLHRVQKLSILCETLHAHIEHVSLYANFFPKFFTFLKYGLHTGCICTQGHFWFSEIFCPFLTALFSRSGRFFRVNQVPWGG
jgi:hypothetical protein